MYLDMFDNQMLFLLKLIEQKNFIRYFDLNAYDLRYPNNNDRFMVSEINEKLK